MPKHPTPSDLVRIQRATAEKTGGVTPKGSHVTRIQSTVDRGAHQRGKRS